MTLRNILLATSRVTESLFHSVVFKFLILFDSEQSLHDSFKYIVLKGKRKALYIVLLHFPRINALCLPEKNDQVTYHISGHMNAENSISTVIFPILMH